MHELSCANCTNRIEPGERHRLTPDGLAHDRCIVTDSTTMHWDQDEQKMKIDDLRILLEMDDERNLPEWVVGAATNNQLRDGLVGYLDMMADSSIQFRAKRSDKTTMKRVQPLLRAR